MTLGFLASELVVSPFGSGVRAAPRPEAKTPAAVPTIVINEMDYHPVDDNPAGEFIELYNTAATTIDMSGWTFSGIDYTFPPGSSMAPGAYLTLTPATYGGGLSNGGERIRIKDSGGNVIDQVTYSDSLDWPAMADGKGESLQRRVATSSGDNPGNWVSADPT
ncbi:MAG TPA: lamin tail domain-containing protein, partial [Ilumatobacteraceae bacterium]